MKKLLKFIKVILTITILLAVATWAFLTFHPVFGAEAKGDSLVKIQNSKNHADGTFQNLVPTTVMTQRADADESILSGMMKMLFPKAGKNPEKPLPSKQFDSQKFTNGDFVWLGHSTILFKTQGKVVLADPVFNRASPVPLFGKSFELENKTEIKDLPPIDAVVISHDHYDHLDHPAIKDLSQKTNRFFVPLGIKAHLLRWGVPEEKIIEMDWYESEGFGDITITLTPTRHFSGRGFSDRYRTLWGGWIISSKDLNVYFGGDTGYFDEFKNIGAQFGPFDIAFLENGAYNEGWAQIHMMPEQSVQAGIDLRARVLFPIHWSKFDLAQHPWDEPIKRFTNAADKKQLTYTTPLIGEVFTLQHLPQEKWWEQLRE